VGSQIRVQVLSWPIGKTPLPDRLEVSDYCHVRTMREKTVVRGAVAVLGSVALVASLGLATPTASQANDAPEPRLAPMASAPITGTPAEILQEIPVTEPLTVGYKAGLFLPVGSMAKKDKRGCTLRNQLLIQMASKKPKVGRGCKLTGGEWLVDFGTKKIKKPSQVKLGTLLPDKYVYAQGAYGWTEKQRATYAENYAPSKTKAVRNRAARTGLFTSSTQQPSNSAVELSAMRRSPPSWTDCAHRTRRSSIVGPSPLC